MLRWRRWVIERPRTILGLVAVVSALAIGVLARDGLQFDSAPTTLTSLRDPAWEKLAQARATFGDDRLVILAVETPDVFGEETIRRLDRLSSKLSSLRGVSQVLSLTNAQQVVDDGRALRVQNLVSLPLTADLTRALRDRLRLDPLFQRHLVSADLQVTSLTIFLRGTTSSSIVDQIRTMAEQEFAPKDLHLVGEPVMERHGSRMMVQDLVTFTPIALLLVAGTFLVSFRAWGMVSILLSSAVITVIWTLAAMALAGRPVTVTTLTLPVLLSAIVASYATHVINQFHLSRLSHPAGPDRSGHSTAAWQAIGFISPVVLVSGTTTFAGFGALAITDIPATRDLGVFGALGVLLGTILSLTLVPSALVLHPQPPGHSLAPRAYARALDGPLLTIARWAIKRPARIHILSALLCLFALAGTMKLRVHTNYLNFSRPNSDLRRAVAFIQERLAGAATFEIVIETAATDYFHQFQGLQELSLIEDYLRGLEGIDATLSVADVVRSMASTIPLQGFRAVMPTPNFTDGKTSAGRQEFSVKDLFQDLLDRDPTTHRLASEDGSKALIFVRSRLFGSTAMNRVIQDVETWARKRWPHHRIYATGTFVLLNHTSDAVARSQVRSLSLALVSIMAMMVILFRSVRLGLLALLPNLLPIFAFFGVMGLCHTPLDINTSLVASIVLGLAVDNAVHLIWRYRARLKDSATPAEALTRSLLETGKPMIVANMTLTLAFSIFALSNFPPVRFEGWLAGFTITVCLLANLIFLPALMGAGALRTAWHTSVPDPAPHQRHP